MHPVILAIHNIARWAALVLLVAAVVRAFIGWFGKKDWLETDRKVGSFTAIAMDIQLLLGLLLYFVTSPLTKLAFQDFGYAMSNTDLRFFTMEHSLMMILAVVMAHLGSALPKRAEESPGKFKRAAIFFTIALLLVLAGIPWGRPLLPGL